MRKSPFRNFLILSGEGGIGVNYLLFTFSIFAYYSIGLASVQLFMAKMHQKRPYLHIHNLLITNKIIIILPILTFSLERFFSIFSFFRCCETQRWLLNNLWSHHYEGAVTVVEEFLSECLNIVGGYAFEDAEILIFVVITLVVVS